MHRDVSYGQRVVLGLSALVLVMSSAAVGIKAALGAYASVYSVKATFPRSGQGLDTFSTVKIRGMTVGGVASIKLLPDGQAQVTMHIQDGTPIPDTVVASAEPLSVFGPKYIKLEPGAHEGVGPYLRDGDTITNTQAPTEVTDLLAKASRLLDAIDPDELFTVVHTVAQGLDGLGPELGRTIDNAGKVASVLDKHSPDTAQFLRDLAQLSSTLASKGQALTTTASNLNEILPTLATRSDALGTLLDQTSQLSADLADLVNGHAPALHDLVNGLSPAVSALYQQLGTIPQFLEANTILLGAIGTTLLTYTLPDGHIVAVVRGPASVGDPCFFTVGLPICPPLKEEPVPG
jgi:phospholipid/cholesterol/gamma-HCH transport system substrate-binding protein